MIHALLSDRGTGFCQFQLHRHHSPLPKSTCDPVRTVKGVLCYTATVKTLVVDMIAVMLQR